MIDHATLMYASHVRGNRNISCSFRKCSSCSTCFFPNRSRMKVVVFDGEDSPLCSNPYVFHVFPQNNIKHPCFLLFPVHHQSLVKAQTKDLFLKQPGSQTSQAPLSTDGHPHRHSPNSGTKLCGDRKGAF